MQINTVTPRSPIQPVICLLVTLSFSVPTRAQTKEADVFASIPTPVRARLVERLKVLIEYQRTQQWDKQYELLSVLFTQGKTRQEFVKLYRRWYAQGLGDMLLDFTPKSVTAHSESIDHGEWTIFGCAKLRQNNDPVHLEASVTAWREKGDWFFSTVGVITPIHGNAKPCRY